MIRLDYCYLIGFLQPLANCFPHETFLANDRYADRNRLMVAATKMFEQVSPT